MGNRFTRRSSIALLATAFAVAILSGCGSTEEKTDASNGTTGATVVTAATSSNGSVNGGDTGETGGSAGGSNSSSGNSGATPQAPEPPPIQILGGDDTGIHVNEPTIIIVRTRKEFSKLKKDHFSQGVEKRPVIGADFKTRQIVALFMPLQKRGVLVQITSIDERGGKIVVEAVKVLPAKGCKTSTQKSRPFHIVETRQMQGTPTLKLEILKSSDC